MTQRFDSRGLRTITIIALVAVLVGGAYVLSSRPSGRHIVAYFTSAVGIYPGDQVRILGVPVGTIDAIEPRPSDVKVTMSVSDDIKVPKDAQAVMISPNLVAARFIQLTPVYSGGAAHSISSLYRSRAAGCGDQPGRRHARRHGPVVSQRVA
jgi:phospholipid/cholesterol/gamma-HCH transport system substrate-binding protein